MLNPDKQTVADLKALPKTTIGRRSIPMRAIEAKTFSGYGGLQQIELAKPQPAKGKVLVRITAAGVTPLDHTVLSGAHPRAKAPLVLGNEGAGVTPSDRGSAVW
jgi:NADPH:quinone reductase-like Zn-dependent oxidoreductase